MLRWRLWHSPHWPHWNCSKMGCNPILKCLHYGHGKLCRKRHRSVDPWCKWALNIFHWKLVLIFKETNNSLSNTIPSNPQHNSFSRNLQCFLQVKHAHNRIRRKRNEPNSSAVGNRFGLIYIQRLRRRCHIAAKYIAPKSNLLFWCYTVTMSICDCSCN